LHELGVLLDAEANASARGEAKIHADASRAQIWVAPTNEELIVARQAQQLLQG
jgi:acetate kinase